MHASFRSMLSAFAVSSLIFCLLQAVAPASAVDCYPPGSCDANPTSTYERIAVSELALSAASASQCAGGVCMPMAVQKTITDTGITLSTSGGVTVRLQAVAGGGQATQVAADGTLVVSASGGVKITLTGLQPGTWVDVYLNSNRIFIGKVRVGADGTVNATLPLPAAASAGDHTAQVLATDSAGRAVSVALGLLVRGSVRTGAARFVFRDAMPFGSTKVRPGARQWLRAGLLDIASASKLSVSAASKLAKCSASVRVVTGEGKQLLPTTCMTFSRKDGKAEFGWTVPTAYRGWVTAVFTFKEPGRAATTLRRTFAIN